MTNPYLGLVQDRRKQRNPYESIVKGPPTGGPIDSYDAFYEEEEQPFFLKKAWDIGKFLYSSYGVENENTIGDVASAFAEGAKRSWRELKETVQDKGIGEFIADQGRSSLGAIKEIITSNPLETANNFANGLLEFFVENPLEAGMGIKNVNGEAIPMTPEEQAEAVQRTIANAANLLIQRGFTAKLLKAPVGRAATQTTKLGNLGKTILTNAAAEAGAATLTEPLAQLGQEGYAEKVAIGAITSVAAGTVLGSLFDYGRYNRAVQGNRIDFTKAQTDLVNARAAANFLHANPTKSAADIVSAVNGILASDDILEAAVRSGLHNKGFIVPQLGVDESIALIEKIKAAPKKESFDFKLGPPYTSTLRPTYKGVPIEWGNDLDLVAYHAQARGFQKHPELMKEVMDKFGLTKEQLIAHGKYVKQHLKEMEQMGAYAKLTQGDIDALETGYRARGMEFLQGLRDRTTVKDFNGREWTKDGDTLVSGNLRVPINSETNFAAFGKDPNNVDPIGGRKLVVDKQPFYGDFNRNAESIDITFGPRGEALVHGHPLSPEAFEMFTQTGFLPMQRVEIAGVGEGYVFGFGTKLQNLIKTAQDIENPQLAMDMRFRIQEAFESDQTVRVKHWDPIEKRWKVDTVGIDKLTRMDSGGVSSTTVADEGVRGFSLGELDPERYTQEFVGTVKRLFEDEILTPISKGKKVDITFEDVYQRARHALNLSEATAKALRDPVYSMLNDLMLSRTLDPEDQVVYSSMQKLLAGQVAKEELSKAGFFRQLTDRNGYYVVDNGTHIQIRDLQTNKLITTVKDLDEGINFMAKSGRNPLPVYDGVIPSDFNRLGNLANTPAVSDTKISQLMDAININTLGINFVPIRDMWASLANEIDRIGLDTKKMFGGVEKINDAIMKRRMFFAEQKPLMESYKKILQEADGLADVDLDQIYRYMETLTPQDIVDRYLSRKMSDIETNFAQKLAKSLSDANETIDVINNAYIAGTKAGKIGGVDFRMAVTETLRRGGVDPSLVKSIVDFTDLMVMHGQEKFSGHAVLKLAEALRKPSDAISPADYAKQANMSPRAIQVAEKLKKLFNEAGTAAGIANGDRIGAYLPHISQIATYSGYKDIPIPDGFAREMNRVLADRKDLVRNPLSLAFMYIQSAANHKAGIADEMAALSKELFDDKEGLTYKLDVTSDQGKRVAGLTEALFARYKDAVMGYPDLSDKMRAVNRGIFSRLFGTDIKGSYSSGSLVALIDSAYVGARPIQAIRDSLTSIGVTYSLFGLDFLRKSLWDGMKFSPRDLDKLEVDLKIPRTVAQDFLAPDTDYATGAAIGAKEGFFKKAQDVGLAISGQQAVYVRTLAGIYKETERRVIDLLGQAQRQEITMDEAVKALKIRVHNPAVQRQFLAFANSGDIEGAARFLGKWNGKVVANNYGEMQSPITWRKGVGRMLGQFGSWGANMMQTGMNATREFGGPHWEESMARTLRFSAFTAAVMAVGNEYGIDLKNVLFTPVQSAPGIGPVVDLAMEMQEAGQGLFSPDENVARKSYNAIGKAFVPGFTGWTDVGKWYIPWSFQMRDILKATEAWDNGSDPFEVTAKLLGVRTVQ